MNPRRFKSRERYLAGILAGAILSGSSPSLALDSLDSIIEGSAEHGSKVDSNPEPAEDRSSLEQEGESSSESQTRTKVEEKPKATKLFGRIEQIAADANVKLPELKAQKAQMDTSGTRLGGKADESRYSGSVSRDFPEDFAGIWGGQLSLWSYSYSPTYLQVDRAECVRSAQLLKKGRKGNVNFHFYKTRSGQIALEPATMLMSIPLKEASAYDSTMKQMGGSQLMSGMLGQMMGNMEQPILQLHFGAVTTGNMTKGVSGNEFRSQVYRNVIRQLAPGVLEQQIVTKTATTVKGTGKLNKGYDESVMRFTRQPGNKFYVLVASVRYTEDGKYLSKLIMNGIVTKGTRVATDPMSGVNTMMQQMMRGNGRSASPGGSIFGGGGGAGGLNLNDLMKQLNSGGR